MYNLKTTNVMKKFIFTIAAALFLTTAMAQDANSEKQNHKRMDPSEMINKRTQEMTQKYSLSAEQAEKLKALNEKYMNKAGQKAGKQMGKSERPEQPKTDAKRPEGKHRAHRGPHFDMTAYNNELKGILNDSQFKAYTEDMEKMKAERKNRREEKKTK